MRPFANPAACCLAAVGLLSAALRLLVVFLPPVSAVGRPSVVAPHLPVVLRHRVRVAFRRAAVPQCLVSAVSPRVAALRLLVAVLRPLAAVGLLVAVLRPLAAAARSREPEVG